jgi:hypothetical protein
MFRFFQLHVVISLTSLSLVLTMFQLAEAQRRERGGIRPGNVSPARLLTVEAVQKELKLSDEQKANAAVINETLTVGRQTVFGEVPKDTGKRGPKVAELNRQAQASIDKLLDDAQKKRFAELLLQVNGASELDRKEVREALRITEEQLQKLAEVRKANAKIRREALANYDGDRMAKTVELQRDADKKLMDVLTDEQRKQFEEMQGKKITIDLFQS